MHRNAASANTGAARGGALDLTCDDVWAVIDDRPCDRRTVASIRRGASTGNSYRALRIASAGAGGPWRERMGRMGSSGGVWWQLTAACARRSDQREAIGIVGLHLEIRAACLRLEGERRAPSKFLCELVFHLVECTRKRGLGEEVLRWAVRAQMQRRWAVLSGVRARERPVDTPHAPCDRTIR